MKQTEFDAYVVLMDDELREETHREFAPCGIDEFLEAYQKKHVNKYGEELTI